MESTPFESLVLHNWQVALSQIAQDQCYSQISNSIIIYMVRLFR